MSTANAQQDKFEQRSVELYDLFGDPVETYSELPDSFKEFVSLIGYIRVCNLLVVNDLKRGRSEFQCATKYGISRAQVRHIKTTNSRAMRRNLAKK